MQDAKVQNMFKSLWFHYDLARKLDGSIETMNYDDAVSYCRERGLTLLTQDQTNDDWTMGRNTGDSSKFQLSALERAIQIHLLTPKGRFLSTL